MLDKTTSALLDEANQAHVRLMAAAAASGPAFASAHSTSPLNILNWLGHDPSNADLLAAVSDFIAARARVAMALRMAHANLSE